jgi:flagellar basal body P-ring formation protein FlgA
MHAVLFRTLLCAVISSAAFLAPPWWLPGRTATEIQQCAHAMTQLPALSFQNRVMVSGQRVNLLDLCEAETLPEDWKIYLAGIDIGAAPDADATKTINLQNLRSYLRQLIESQGLNPDSVTVKLPDKISIERRKQVISKGQIEEIIRQHILSSVPTKPEDVIVQTAGLQESIVVPYGALSWEVLNPLHDAASGNTALTIQLNVDRIKAQSVRVVSKVQVFQKVVCAARSLKRNEIVGTDDLQLLRINVAHYPERFLTDADQVRGKRLMSEVAVNQPIDTQTLDKAIAVKRGSAVAVIYNQEGLKLIAKGQAKEDGGLGDKVRIVNLDSKKALVCRVIDSHTVELIP